METSVQKDRIRGTLIGGAIGDALGYPIEFISSYQDIQLRYGKRGITRFDTVSWRTDERGKEKAPISDDTQMTMFTALGILNAKNEGMAPIPAICQAYIEWLYTQKGMRSQRFNHCWIGDLPEMNVCRAPGETCITALEEILQNRKLTNNSKGCGGIMRIAPIPLYGLAQERISNVAALNELSADAAKLTHQHPLGYIPAYILSHIIYRLATDERPTYTSFINHVKEAMLQAANKYRQEVAHVEYLKTLLDKALVLAFEDLPDQQAIEQLGKGWVAEETLAIAVYCTARHFDNFEEALIASVNHAGDSDSTGSVTGNILGAAIGYTAMPEHFKQGLQLHDVILHIADDLWRGYTTRYSSSNRYL